MKTINCILFASTFFFTSVFAQITPEEPKAPLHSDLSKTLGFIKGQAFTLNKIANEYPSLAPDVQKAEAGFLAVFGTAEKNIKSALQIILKDKYDVYETQMTEQLSKALSKQTIDLQTANAFLKEVESRSKGKVPSPILETLLTYQFKDRPFDEFSGNYTKVFRTKDHPKAKGVDFQIRYPASWQKKEGERPNVIQKFTSENGRGLDTFLLMVMKIPDLPADYKATDKELDEFFTETEMKGMIPDNSHYISGKPIEIENHKGGMMIYDQTVQRLDLLLTMRCLQFVILRGNKMIFVQCMVGVTPGGESTLENRYSQLEPLFKMIANSLVIQEQYK
jgi:hypothetical protein